MTGKSAILHLGFPKTGTTTIQDALYGARQQLLSDAQVLYPNTSANHTNAICTMFMESPERHIHNKTIGATDAELATIRKSYFEQFESDLRQSDWNTVLISAEGAANLSRQELNAFASWLKGFVHDWSVVVWVRHPVAWVNSNAQELLKAGETVASLITRTHMPNYKGRIQNFQEVFGSDKVNVVAYEEAMSFGDGIVARFCADMGLSAELAQNIAAERSTKNASMSYEAACLLNSLNVHRPRFVNGRMGPRRFAADVQPFLRIPGRRFTLGEPFESRVRRRARDDIRWLNATFGFQLYDDIFEETEQAEGEDIEATIPPEDPSFRAIATLVSDLLNERYYRNRLEEGDRFLDSSDFAAAEECFEEAGRTFPRRGDAAYHLSVLHHAKAEAKEAMYFAQRAVALSPKSEEYRKWLAAQSRESPSGA